MTKKKFKTDDDFFMFDNGPSNKLLIVEDEDYVRKLLVRRATQKHNFICRWDSTGESCLKIAKTFQPDVILLDMNLPAISGFGLIRELKRHPVTQDIPIIVLSAHDQLDIVQEAIDLGANNYFVKGEPMESIFQKIESIVLPTRSSVLTSRSFTQLDAGF